MTLKQANDIFRGKYQTGEIWKDKHKICVVFKQGGKVYDYNSRSYVEVLVRTGFDVIYEREKYMMEREIKRLTDEIEKGYVKSVIGNRLIKIDERQKEERLRIIDHYTSVINTAIIVNG